MTPPSADMTMRSPQQQTDVSAEAIDRITWWGWVISGTLLFAWLCSVSGQVIFNARDVHTLEERQSNQFTQLHDQLQEIKSDVKELLRR